MRGLKRSPWLFGLGVLLASLVVYGGHARADVTTDKSGSIVIFPKVIADGTRDTIIELTNTGNATAFAHCFYINASGACSATTSTACSLDSECPTGETCVRQCNEIDFDLFLTAQQPTMWRASTGRLTSTTPPCRLGQACACTRDALSGQLKCPGFDPGTGGIGSPAVIPTGADFVGELKCVQTQQDNQTPFAGNSLKGEAIIETLATGQISEYNGLSITANAALTGGLNTNNDLLLNWPGTGAGEYNLCPASLVFTHYSEDATDSFTNATVSTEVTLVPCTELLESQAPPTPAIVNFVAFTDMEQRISADGINFDCYFSRRMADIPFEGADVFTFSGTGSQFLKTRITPSSSTICLTGANRGLACTTDTNCPGFLTTAGGTTLGCRPATGVLGVAEEFHSLLSRQTGTAAINMHTEGSRPAPGDIIVVPEGP